MHAAAKFKGRVQLLLSTVDHFPPKHIICLAPNGKRYKVILVFQN